MRALPFPTSLRGNKRARYPSHPIPSIPTTEPTLVSCRVSSRSTVLTLDQLYSCSSLYNTVDLISHSSSISLYATLQGVGSHIYPWTGFCHILGLIGYGTRATMGRESHFFDAFSPFFLCLSCYDHRGTGWFAFLVVSFSSFARHWESPVVFVFDTMGL